MIEYTKGNLLDSDCSVLVNTVNCVGVMGKGIALEFKKKYPQMFNVYKEHCRSGVLQPGKLWWWKDYDGPWICCAATKYHWRNPSQKPWIASILYELSRQILCNMESIAIPALGCGNGGLDWKEVKPMIETALGDLPNRIVVYEP